MTNQVEWISRNDFNHRASCRRRDDAGAKVVVERVKRRFGVRVVLQAFQRSQRLLRLAVQPQIGPLPPWCTGLCPVCKNASSDVRVRTCSLPTVNWNCACDTATLVS